MVSGDHGFGVARKVSIGTDTAISRANASLIPAMSSSSYHSRFRQLSSQREPPSDEGKTSVKVGALDSVARVS